MVKECSSPLPRFGPVSGIVASGPRSAIIVEAQEDSRSVDWRFALEIGEKGQYSASSIIGKKLGGYHNYREFSLSYIGCFPVVIVYTSPLSIPNKLKSSFQTLKTKTILLLLLSTITAFAGHPHVKSTIPGSGDGHYGGSSSHRGGHYVNPNTGNHYRDRAHGVAY